MRFGAFLITVLSCAVFALPAHAQYSTEDNPVSLILSTSYPKPYSTVTVTPRSTLVDLISSEVTITANGVVVQKGSGSQGAAVQVGGPGEVTTIGLSVKDASGKTYTTKLSVRPADVALVIEPTSTVHPFYAGLPLLAPQARVRLIAVPDLRKDAKTALDPKTLVYTWKLGERVLESASGIGRSVLVATAPIQHRYADITVTVTSPDQSVVAEAKTSITPTDPIVRIYADDPLKGPDFDTALSGSVELASSEATFRAVPYFFSAAPTLEWSVNNAAQGAQRTITVRPTGTGAGSAALDIRANLTDTLQNATNRITLTFGGSKSPFSIFGF